MTPQTMPSARRSLEPAFTQPIVGLSGAGPKLAEKLAARGLLTLQDLWLLLPLRYEDRTSLTPIARLQPGVAAQVEGRIEAVERGFRYRPVLRVAIGDESRATLVLRFFHFRAAQVAQFAVGARLRVYGVPRQGQQGLEIVHPSYRLLDAQGDTPLGETLEPVYPAVDGVGPAVLRKLISQSLDRLPDQAALELLPEGLLRASRLPDGSMLPSLREALLTMHRPARDADVAALSAGTHPAQRRLALEELLAHHLSLRRQRIALQRHGAHALAGKGALVAELLKTLPFKLTGAQQRVFAQIRTDLAQPHPMLRLVQGDVGSGKTVVAALAAMLAVESGKQVALAAPTELLAEQHLANLRGWLEPLGVRVAWLAGKVTGKARARVLEEVASGTAQVVVGTHALMQDAVAFHDLALAIVDEQHRFGVGQRLALTRKGETVRGRIVPHQLNMSATPIPRTLAMTFFADLDVSVIDELPPGRTPVLTKLVSDARREEVIAHIAQAARGGRQAYWVCPLVEESEALELQTAVDTYEGMRADLPDLRIGLVHGRLPQAEKAAVMQAFREGEIDLLVATTVIEVGVDVPNASMMVIEHAERFGLAQLHQLRGRVGRGTAESVCVLIYQTPLSQVARERLRAMFETSDGFEIARRDLELRGPGEFLGTRQSGMALLRFADLETDAEIAEQARDAAVWLRAEHPAAVEAHLARWMRGREDFLRT